MRALRERRQADCHHPVRRNFNPRSPYGEGHPCGAKCNILGGFNPRSPYGERQAQRLRLDQYSDFNPRSPYGERPALFNPRLVGGGISIHAPRTGSDSNISAVTPYCSYFNPRSPYGERRSNWPFASYFKVFQSTLPVRGATFFQQIAVNGCCISIHAPRTGSDFVSNALVTVSANFNPRSPYGERRASSEKNLHRR